MKRQSSGHQHALQESRINRRSLLLGASAVAGTGTLAAMSQLGGVSQAQISGANPGPATPASLGPAIPPDIAGHTEDWPLPMANYSSTRKASDSPISSDTVEQLEVAWTFPVEASGPSGGMTCQPIVLGDTVYVQDMQSNVFALDRDSGDVRWKKQYDVPTTGPNGVAAGYGMIYGALGDTSEMVALDADSGEEVWRVSLSDRAGDGIDLATLVYDSVVFTSTVPGQSEYFYQGGGRGIVFALDAKTGTTLRQWDTTAGDPGGNLWGNPGLNSGGGVWYPPSIDTDTNTLFFGTGNPGPWPGVVADGTPYPNGSSRPGDNDYTNSMVSLNLPRWTLNWYHNAKPHDLFDADFHLSPILAKINVEGREVDAVIGAGKLGRVLAFDRKTGDVLWDVEVGKHQNDWMTEIPEGETVRVYPGSLGGVETPMAYDEASSTLFAPIVNRWSEYTATAQGDSESYDDSTGELVALDVSDGSVKWKVDLPKMNVGAAMVANDVVFGSALDGILRVYDVASGDQLWTHQLKSGVNATMAIAGDLLVVPAAGPFVGGPEDVEAEPAVVAFRLPEGTSGATPGASPAAG